MFSKKWMGLLVSALALLLLQTGPFLTLTSADGPVEYTVSATLGLNVRSGPGIEYPRVRPALPYGTPVTVIEWGKDTQGRSWAKIGTSPDQWVAGWWLKPAEVTVANVHEAAHRDRLEELDPTFRASGFSPWLRAAGFTWSSLTLRTDQVIEETWSGRQWASGVPVVVTELQAPWPTAMTTDETVPHGRCLPVGPTSKLCTDVKGFTGRATLYVSVLNWAQLTP